jgi:peptide/nickel transport system ATP-binding protein
MLEGRGLGFRYNRRENWLFRGLDITVAAGERVGLPGPSGRGKSTLARVLSSYLTPQEGSVSVDGERYVRGNFNPVQLLFQHPELAVNPRWQIRDILAEAGPPQPRLLERLGIAGAWLARYPHELSGGELQRVCLARALDRRTRYLLCDEMTSMLDALTQATIWKSVLETAAERNIGMLVISHDAALLDRICSRTDNAFSA